MIRVALIGNPNVGKTELFNRLTGLRQHVGIETACNKGAGAR